MYHQGHRYSTVTTFGQIAGFIDIVAANHSGMIGQQLQWDYRQEGLQFLQGVRDGKDMIGMILDLAVTFGGDSDDFAAAGLDFLDVANDFAILTAAEGQQRQRAFLG